jgi:hypothetical protein
MRCRTMIKFISMWASLFVLAAGCHENASSYIPRRAGYLLEERAARDFGTLQVNCAGAEGACNNACFYINCQVASDLHSQHFDIANGTRPVKIRTLTSSCTLVRVKFRRRTRIASNRAAKAGTQGGEVEASAVTSLSIRNGHFPTQRKCNVTNGHLRCPGSQPFRKNCLRTV